MITKGTTSDQKLPAKRAVVIVAVLAAVATGVAYLGIRKLQPRTGIQKGNAAPAFTLSRYGGGTVSLRDLPGKVVLLNFWATWCVPCAAEMPALTRLAREFESRGFIFLAANQDDRETADAQIRLFLAQFAPDLGRSVVFADEQTAISYAVEELPTSFFIGRDGRIIESYAGYAPESLLRQKIERAISR